MSRENAIVRKLYAVEGLGAVNIICSDKTGTLTQNRMTVVQYVSADGNGKIKRGGNNQVSDTIQLLAKGMVVCSDATYSEGVATGDPTEIALLLFADDLQIDRDTLLKEYPRVTEYPFDSDRKMMSTLSRVAEDQYRVFTKGAMDKLLEISSWVLLDGEVVPLTEELKAEFYQDIEKLSSQALRTLGLAYKDSHHLLSPEEMESELVLVGMVGMIDPPRPEVKEAISLAQDAGIMTIMITGDHQHTAFAIGRELGIVEQEKQVISGYEMDQLSDHQLFQTIHQYRIFARVSPEHKVKIVQALQGHKNIVAMT